MLDFNKQKMKSCINCNKLSYYLDNHLECFDCIKKFEQKMQNLIGKNKCYISEMEKNDRHISQQIRKEIAQFVFENKKNYATKLKMQNTIIEKFGLDKNLTQNQFQFLTCNKTLKKFGFEFEKDLQNKRKRSKI